MQPQSVAIPSRQPVTASKPFHVNPLHVLCKPVGPKCNLDCEYCFYLEKTELYPEQNRFEMSLEALETHVRAYIENQPLACREVTFGWQGGEPTLRGLAFFEQAVALQKRYARPGMRITNTLQTNAILLNDEWARFLKANHFLVGVSIDGDQALHDRYRKTRRGRGSYAKVHAGLAALLKHGVDVNLLCVVNADNAQHGERVYRHLTGLGVQFLQFIPLVEPISGKGMSLRSVAPRQFGEFMLEVFHCWRAQDIGRVFVSHFDNALGMTLGMPSSSCVHAPVCGNNVVAEHNGDVYSCDHFVYPEYRLGNIAKSSYAELLNTPTQHGFAALKPQGEARHCQGCAVRHLCHGGCPAHRLNSKGEQGGQEKAYLCEGYKRFFTQTRPYFEAMATCLRRGLPASEYPRFFDTALC